MRIALFTDCFLPQTNGIVTSIVNLARGLADKNHHITIVAPAYSRVKEFEYKNITVIRTQSVPVYFYPEFRITAPLNMRIVNYLQKSGVDIIHFTTPFTVGIQGILGSKIAKIPLIGTFHTFIADPAYLKHGYVNNRFFQYLGWKYLKLLYDSSALITCPSEYAKSEMLMHHFRKPIKVISNGINPDMFDNRNAVKIKQKYNHHKLLLFIGRIAYEKNINTLIDIYRLIYKKTKNTRLLIIGDGPQFEKIKRKINLLHLSKNIILLGRMEYNQLIQSGIFGACDLFITASGTENQPMTILEAQANGIVCLGFDVKGIPNLIKDGENGFLITHSCIQEFADKVLELIHNERLYKKFRENTLKGIAKHSLSKVIINWENIYKQVVVSVRKVKPWDTGWISPEESNAPV